MKVLIVFLMALAIPMSGFAKSNKRVHASQVKLKFSPAVYYKLDHKNRLKYLNAFMDVAVEIEKEMKRDKQASQGVDLMHLLFPTADAQVNGICLIGGVYYKKPANGCGDSIPQEHQYSELNSFYSCGPAKRCAAYFGTDSSGQGFCFSKKNNETADCDAQSKAKDGAKNLAAVLNNCAAKKAQCDAFNAAISKDQAELSAYCGNRTKGACGRSKTAIAALTGVADQVPAGSSADSKTGCTEGMLGQMSGDTPESLAKQLNMKNGVDPYWYQMAKIATFACDSTKKSSTSDIFKNTGVCEARSGAEVACTAPQTELAKCVSAKVDELGQDGFRKYVAGVDSSICSRSGSSYTCRDGKSPLQIRNDVEAGKVDGMDRLLGQMCGSKFSALTTCRSSVGGDALQAKPDVSKLLMNSVEAEAAARALERGDKPTDTQAAGFEKFFGVSPKEFKDFFCAKNPEDFRVKSAQAFFSKGASGSAIRARMQACTQQTVQLNKRFNQGAEVVDSRSNYQDRHCKQEQVRSVNESQVNSNMKNYMYYEKDTGRCFKGTDVVTSLPSNLPASCKPTCARETTGIVSTPRYLKIEHTYTGSDVEPCYACLDKEFFDSKKFDIFNVRCQTDEMGGLEFPAVTQ